MCSTIFYCEDEPESIAQMTLAAMAQLLQQAHRDERAASQMLSLASRLWTIVADGNRRHPGRPHTHKPLLHSTDALYQAVGQLFHNPTSSPNWQRVTEQHQRCWNLFFSEMAACRTACG